MAVLPTPVLLLLPVMFLSTVHGDSHGEHGHDGGHVQGEMELPHSLILDPDDKYHVSWGFNKTHITFKVEVQTLGYVGLGFSPNGGMVNSDIMIGWVNDDDMKPVITDRFAYEKSEPKIDMMQDFNLLYGSQNSTHTVLKFSRSLKICDRSDRTIREETIRLIWAHSEMDPNPDGTGAAYHRMNRGVRSVYLLDPVRENPEIPNDAFTLDLLARDVLIPSNQTTYMCQAYSVPKLDRKHHIVKIAPIIQTGRESEVHHIVLYGCTHEVLNPSSINSSHVCRDPNMPKDWHLCTMAVMAWAVGGEDFYFPGHVGFPMGMEDSPTMFMMEVHYDNPTGKSGLRDSSGLQLFLTPSVRQYDAGFIMAGYVPEDTQVVPPFYDSFRVDGHCTKQCLQQAMEGNTDELNVFAVLLHTHTAGHKLRVRHFRDGVEEKQLVTDENYDFNFQAARMLEKEVPIKYGDNLVTECFYNTLDRSAITYGGESTQEEMCISFIMYYPKIPLSFCMSSANQYYFVHFAEATLNDTLFVTTPTKSAGKYWKNFMDEEIDWSDSKVRDDFQKFMDEPATWSTVAVCSDINKTYQSNIKGFEVPKILPENEYSTETEHVCGVVTNGSRLTVITSGGFIIAVLLACLGQLYS